MSESPNDLLSAPEVAERLGFSLRKVRSMIASGELPSVRLSARARRVLRSDVEDLIVSRREGGDA